ncbi:MAG: hypothetical protein U0872_04250 [Planctomycetaceae bacterium]
MVWQPPLEKSYRITLVYPSGYRKPLDGHISLSRALQIKNALQGIFPEILIEEQPLDPHPRQAA